MAQHVILLQNYYPEKTLEGLEMAIGVQRPKTLIKHRDTPILSEGVVVVNGYGYVWVMKN